MIYKNGDLLTVNSGIIVQGCNAQGVMGSGVAKLLKEKYPSCFQNYITDLNSGHRLGDVSWSSANSLSVYSPDDLCIASGITQEFYGRDPNVQYVSYDAITDVFDEIFVVAKDLDRCVNMPKIGAGLGNGDWSIIENLIEESAQKSHFPQEKIFVWVL